MLYLLPFIAAFIGWFTNFIAVKMLFHPRKPVKFLGITIQGIFPKRQTQFAQKLGTLVSNELISFDEIANKINTPNTTKQALPIIEQHIDHFIQHKLKEEIPLLSMFITEKSIASIKQSMVTEVENMFPTLIQKMVEGIKNDLDIEKIVIEKVNNFSSDKLEQILFSIMKKEFRFIEIIGAILGFVIGLLQILLAKIS